MQTTLLSWLISSKTSNIALKKGNICNIFGAFEWKYISEKYFIYRHLNRIYFLHKFLPTSWFVFSSVSILLICPDNTRFNTESKKCLYFLKQYQKNIWCNLKEKHTSLGHCKMKDINKFQVVVESITFFFKSEIFWNVHRRKNDAIQKWREKMIQYKNGRKKRTNKFNIEICALCFG